MSARRARHRVDGMVWTHFDSFVLFSLPIFSGIVAAAFLTWSPVL